MTLFVDLLTGITIPMVVLIAVGYLLRWRLAVDVASLNRVVVYAVLPAFLFYHLATAEQPLARAATAAWFTLAQFFALLAVGWAGAALVGLAPNLRPVVALAVAFPNSGNYGIPLIELAFGAAAVPQQAVMVSLHTILLLTVGVPLLARGEARGAAAQPGAPAPPAPSPGRLLREAFRTPLIPAVLAGLAIKALALPLPPPIGLPLKIAGSALTPLALIALGAQLAAARPLAAPRGLGLGLLLRLGMAPLLTFAAVRLLGFSQGLEELLVVGACTPVGVLLAIVAAEFGARETLTTPLVIASTALSPFVATLALLLLRAG